MLSWQPVRLRRVGRICPSGSRRATVISSPRKRPYPSQLSNAARICCRSYPAPCDIRLSGPESVDAVKILLSPNNTPAFSGTLLCHIITERNTSKIRLIRVWKGFATPKSNYIKLLHKETAKQRGCNARTEFV